MTVLVFKTSSQNCAANSQSDLIELGSVSMLPKNRTKNKKLDLPWASGNPGGVTLVISAGEVKLVTIEAEL